LSVEELKENYEKEKEKLKEMAGEEKMETDNVQKGWYNVVTCYFRNYLQVSALYLVMKTNLIIKTGRYISIISNPFLHHHPWVNSFENPHK